ncbi:MAG: hypothetical protein ACRCZJ_07060, partial [Erysipelotrichaceae bacterium]
KTARYRDGYMLTLKYPNRFFVSTLGITTGGYLNRKVWNENLTIEEYIEKIKVRSSKKADKTAFMKYALAK